MPTTLSVLCLLIFLVWYASVMVHSDFANWEDTKPPPLQRKKTMGNMLMRWEVYKSERFVVTGNMYIRIVITDTHEDKSYEIEHSDLHRFRCYWDKILADKRDTFILAAISSRTGKENKKVA